MKDTPNIIEEGLAETIEQILKSGKEACALLARLLWISGVTLKPWRYDTKPLTIEELKRHIKEKDAEPLWVEKNYCNEVSEWRLAKDIADWLENPVCADEYNNTWRCWNSHPKERVRKEAKWGDESSNEHYPHCGAKIDLED